MLGITETCLVIIFGVSRSFGAVLQLVHLILHIHQPRSGEQSYPHAGAGLLHADRWM